MSGTVWQQNKRTGSLLICEERKRNVKSVRHEKKPVLIPADIVLIKVWLERMVNNATAMNAS